MPPVNQCLTSLWALFTREKFPLFLLLSMMFYDVKYLSSQKKRDIESTLLPASSLSLLPIYMRRQSEKQNFGTVQIMFSSG